MRDIGTPQSRFIRGARTSSPTLPGESSMENPDRKYRLLRAKPVPAPIMRMYACQRAERSSTARLHSPANARYAPRSAESRLEATFCASETSASAAYMATGAASSGSQEYFANHRPFPQRRPRRAPPGSGRAKSEPSSLVSI